MQSTQATMSGEIQDAFISNNHVLLVVEPLEGNFFAEDMGINLISRYRLWFLLLRFWLRINCVLMRQVPVNMKFAQITHRVCSENCFRYVTVAKMILQNNGAMISIDMPPGPSEVLVIVDKHANPVYIATNFLSQAEHGPDSQVVLVFVGEGVNLDEIEMEL
jgi:hypothetical protein